MSIVGHQHRGTPKAPSPRAFVPFDTEAAIEYGKIRADLERQEILLGDADIRIAAIALVRGLTMITGNIHHFHRVP
ncbi:MAG: type II toxin-antitoxin system VapC family toxin [Chloroflexi bacterium]|nr:type II toxin-antitoxin system VapC family toxin [Chloroflexota bacterium]MBM3155610.1 type II toxin-antitoxin system VapC family toxin [Chloroflexota bacterium]